MNVTPPGASHQPVGEPLPVSRPRAPTRPAQGPRRRRLVLVVWAFFPVFFYDQEQNRGVSLRMSQLSLRYTQPLGSESAAPGRLQIKLGVEKTLGL